jgi:hypothetical protein
MGDLKEFFEAVSKEKKIQQEEVEELISTSFDDFFIKPLIEETKPKKRDKSTKTKFIKEDHSLLEKSLGLLAEPTSTKNQDPLTPLDQNFLTVDAFQKHYQSFLSRIQQQLSIIGGGGETRLEFLDDVDRNSAKVNNKFLRYNTTNKKWEGADPGSSGMQYSTTTVSTNSYTIKTTDYYIGVNFQGAVTITLPDSSTNGTCYVIKDELGQASNGANRYIQIISSGSDTIDGKPAVTIAFDYGSITIIYNNGWRVV